MIFSPKTRAYSVILFQVAPWNVLHSNVSLGPERCISMVCYSYPTPTPLYPPLIRLNWWTVSPAAVLIVIHTGSP